MQHGILCPCAHPWCAAQRRAMGVLFLLGMVLPTVADWIRGWCN